MKKMISATVVAAVFCSLSSNAQGWKNGGNALIATGKFGTTSNQDIQFISNNVINGALTKTGRWGMGVTIPGAKLHINSAFGEDALRVQVNNSTKLLVTSDGGVTIGSLSNGPVNGLFVSGSTGIGTNTPSSKLHVKNGNAGITPFFQSVITAESADNAYVNILAPSIHESGILFGTSANNVSGGIIYNSSFLSPALNGLQFRTNGNIPRMELNGDGMLNIGPGVNDDYRLRVDHASVLGLDIASSSTGTDWELFAGTSGLNLFVDGGAGGAKGIFNRFTGVYSSLSDERAKTNIKPMTDVLEKINQLKPSSYQFKNTKDQQEYDGFIAQEVMKVFPNLVTHNVETKRNVDEYLLNYNGFGVIAVKAIQELVQVINKQEQRIAVLEQAAGTSISNSVTDNSTAKNNMLNVTGASLEQNQPNPFNNTTTIRYTIPQGSKAQLQVFNTAGMLVKTFNANESGQAVINAGELSAGTYTYNLIVNGRQTSSKKMMLIK